MDYSNGDGKPRQGNLDGRVERIQFSSLARRAVLVGQGCVTDAMAARGAVANSLYRAQFPQSLRTFSVALQSMRGLADPKKKTNSELVKANPSSGAVRANLIDRDPPRVS
ncbi:hypothetical protein [Lysobacter capsici]|uniref:hypothetical protein n=1 Tax=Lysobacter capsici TaxID=435897 RepID=UPI001C001EFE|nr:hypothetical protein [Lysobacter capsici]QWF18836.1 hypothetical protein KME82_08905 [Lysobacter capsici]